MERGSVKVREYHEEEHGGGGEKRNLGASLERTCVEQKVAVPWRVDLSSGADIRLGTGTIGSSTIV